MRYMMAVETPVGEIWLVQEGDALVLLSLPGEGVPSGEIGETPLLAEAAAQIRDFFEGRRAEFDLPLDARGTPFQKAVWVELQRIPAGETRSYRDVAKAVGRPGASRAVGSANHRNPLPLLIPCHRVIGAGGELVGYGGGLPVKQRLLELEAEFYRPGARS